MDIARVGPDDTELIEQLTRLGNEINEVDAPFAHPSSLRTMQAFVRHGWDGEPATYLLGLVDDEAVALGRLDMSTYDNTDLAWVNVGVHPKHRERGLGDQMYRHLLDRVREAGRHKLGTDSWDDNPAVGFAERRGFTRASVGVMRRQHLDEVSWPAIEALYDGAAAAAAAYELLRMPGRLADDWVGPVTELASAINDAPNDDLDIEDEVFVPERMRGYEEAAFARGYQLYRVVARHRETGELAGHTVVAVEQEEGLRGEQHDTSVARDHRGHRLGLLLKSAAMLWVREVEPALATIDTWNAESNDHMIGVNETLGYRPVGRALEFNGRLPGR